MVTFEDEFPEEASALMRSFAKGDIVKINQSKVPLDRNSACDCGSGLKYKRCCSLIPQVKNPARWSMVVTRGKLPKLNRFKKCNA